MFPFLEYTAGKSRSYATLYTKGCICKGLKNKEVFMLKLTLHPGDFIDIGDDIRVVFSGGSANNIHLLIDAPKDVNIVRNTAQQRREKSPYFAEPKLSPKAQREIADILMQEKKSRQENGAVAKRP